MGVIIVGLLFVLESWLLAFREIAFVTAPPTVLVVGEFSKKEEFAESVHVGLTHYFRDMRGSGRERILIAQLNSDETSQATFSQRFCDAIATQRVIAVVSATRSQNTSSTLRLAEVFHLPALVAVATEDALLPKRQYNTIRLIPNDSQQARMIVAWAEHYRSVLVISDDSDYGTSLAERCCSVISKNISCFRTALGHSNDALAVLREHQAWQPDAIVFTGYYRDVPNIFVALSILHMDVPVCLSDGCYSSQLRSLCARYNNGVWLTFPITLSSDDTEPSGFSVVGRDAAIAIDFASQQASDRSTPRYRFIDDIRSSLSSGALAPHGLASRYNYYIADDNYASENQIGTFVLNVVHSNATSKPADP